MNCAKCRKLLVAHAEGLLGGRREQAITLHLQSCGLCRGEADTLAGLRGRLVRYADALAGRPIDAHIMDRIRREGKTRSRSNMMIENREEARSPRMRWLKAVTIPTAALVLLAAGLVYWIGGRGVAFADVIEHVRSARTLTYNLTVQLDEKPAVTVPTMRMEPGRIRQIMPGGGIMIMDMAQGKSLVLDPNEKKAILMRITGQPQMTDQMSGGFIEELRNLRDGSEEMLGKQEINGQDAVGFQVHNGDLNWTIWADAQTGLPIHIQIQMEGGMFGEGTATMTDFKFDVDLDESLFSLTPPEGYTLEEMQVDASEPSENDLIEALRFVADIMDDGAFPPEFTIQGMSEVMKRIGGLASNDEEKKAVLRALTVKAMRAFMFAHKMTADNDWHYVGKDVKLGEAQKPVCWWLPGGSDTYRIIYGDLSIRDIQAADLPTSP